jgi:hypothetical protein
MDFYDLSPTVTNLIAAVLCELSLAFIRSAVLLMVSVAHGRRSLDYTENVSPGASSNGVIDQLWSRDCSALYCYVAGSASLNSALADLSLNDD